MLAGTLWIGLLGIVSLRIAYPDDAMSRGDELLGSLLDGLWHGMLAQASAAADSRGEGGGPGQRAHPGVLDARRAPLASAGQSTDGTVASTRVGSPRAPAGARNAAPDSSRRMHVAASS